jgi:hypothetical protein
MTVDVYGQSAERAAAIAPSEAPESTERISWALALILLGGLFTIAWIGVLVWLLLLVFAAI